MNGELAQVMALVAHGNLLLSDPARDSGLLDANSTFQHVGSLSFVRCQGERAEGGIEVAATVRGWLDDLRSMRVRRLWCVGFAWPREWPAEHEREGISNGVPRAIQADLPRRFELWYPQWEARGTAADERPWHVSYRTVPAAESQAQSLPPLAEVKEILRRAIAAAAVWAGKQAELVPFVAFMNRAVEQLDAAAPVVPYHPDLLPEDGYGLEARQVAAAAASAYVFGGMGSWNDVGFSRAEDEQRHASVSKELHWALKLATILAANSFQAAPRSGRSATRSLFSRIFGTAKT